LAIYSVSERKTIAERIIARGESEAEMLWTSWMPDGRSLVALGEGRRGLSIFGPDLQETDRIDLPARIKQPWGLAVVGNQVLITDGKTDSLWRLDLDTKRWKRVF
jgi:sugar lactone lactonase YvrE